MASIVVEKTSKKTKKRSTKSTKRAARTRRQRGYFWEDTLVKRFNGLENWRAFRLGSPSTGLPDVIAVSSKENMLFSIEAKSGTVESLVVPYDQIERCIRWASTFDLYQKRHVILAFKFLSKKRIGTNQYESRELREFYKIWDLQRKAVDTICTYDGNTFELINGKRTEMHLDEYNMPFRIR